MNNGLENLTIRKIESLHSKIYACTNAGLYAKGLTDTVCSREITRPPLQLNGITPDGGDLYIATT